MNDFQILCKFSCLYFLPPSLSQFLPTDRLNTLQAAGYNFLKNGGVYLFHPVKKCINLSEQKCINLSERYRSITDHTFFPASDADNPDLTYHNEYWTLAQVPSPLIASITLS